MLQTIAPASLWVTPPLTLISVVGPDAVKFLQGQLTCDLRELASPSETSGNTYIQGPTLLGAQCNNKGRVLMVFYIFQPSSDRILIQVNTEIAPNILANLRKYAVFFKVTLSDESDRFHPVAILGSNAKSLLENKLGVEIHSDTRWYAVDQHFSVSSENTHVLWLSGDSNNQASLKNQILETCIPGTESDWTLHQISLGLASVSLSSQELFTPQDLNLTLIQGVNFKKGCYTGQEIVARLHYKAKLKRHMYRFEASSTLPPPKPGDSLRDSQGKNLGEVVSAAKRDESRIELLASISDHGISDAFIEGISQKLRQLPLPYAIPSENE